MSPRICARIHRMETTLPPRTDCSLASAVLSAALAPAACPFSRNDVPRNCSACASRISIFSSGSSSSDAAPSCWPSLVSALSRLEVAGVDIECGDLIGGARPRRISAAACRARPAHPSRGPGSEGASRDSCASVAGRSDRRRPLPLRARTTRPLRHSGQDSISAAPRWRALRLGSAARRRAELTAAKNSAASA